MKRFFASLCAGLTIPFTTKAAPVTITLPIETALYKPAAGSDLANAQCLTCHSAEYVSSQPPMPRAFWKGSIEKMIGKYGAPVPPEQIEALTDYFSSNYGSAEKSTPPPVTQANAVSSAATTDAKQLMQKSGCFNCHAVDRKFIGPSFKDVAEKYKGTVDSDAKVTRQITHGGAGLWGPIPMPPFKQFSQAQLKSLVDWILAQK